MQTTALPDLKQVKLPASRGSTGWNESRNIEQSYTNAMLHSPSGSWIVSGGTDRFLRYWDLLVPEKSFAICRPNVPSLQLEYRYNFF